MKTKRFLTVALLITNLFAFASEDLRVEITKTDVTCFGQANGKAELYIAGGKQPYAITWSNGQNGSSISNLNKGTYIFKVTDAKGNTIKDSVKITMPAPISINYNVPNFTSAANFNADLNVIVKGGTPWEFENATSMYIFKLNGKTYYEHPEKLEDGVYKLTIEDARGCQLNTNINLQVKLDNCTIEKPLPAYNGYGNVTMTVHPIHLVIEQQQKDFSHNYN